MSRFRRTVTTPGTTGCDLEKVGPLGRSVTDRSSSDFGSRDATPQDSVEPLLVGAKVAASLLGFSERLLWSLSIANEIPSVRVRGRRLYSLTALRAWIAERQTNGARS